MTNNLTTIASLPGSGGGCLASLPAEKNESAVQEHDELVFPPIDLGPIGGDGPKVWPALEGGYGC